MLTRARRTFLGLCSIALFLANTLAAGVPVSALVLARLLPGARWRRHCARALTAVAETWIACNNLNQRWTQPTVVHAHGIDGLHREGRYVLLCNHRSAVDIVVLQRLLTGRIPLLRFFIKRQLAWVPVLGLAWWALGFPFMRRYSRAHLQRHPEHAGADLRTARAACARLVDQPLTLVNFVEGTRFSTAKQQRQCSPFRHLLQPRAGGTAAAIAALGPHLDAILDVTLHYPGGAPTLLDLFFGRVPEIVLQVEAAPVPDPALALAYVEDPEQREPFARWLDARWRRKDRALSALIDAPAVQPRAVSADPIAREPGPWEALAPSRARPASGDPDPGPAASPALASTSAAP